jgi:hypothetical protein
MSEGVTTGLLTLGGVIVGGAINAALGRYSEARQRRQLARTNARLLLEDVRSATRVVRRMIERQSVTPLQRRMNVVDSYRERRDQLAASMEWTEWGVVSQAFRNLSELIISVSERASTEIEGTALFWLEMLCGELEHADRILTAIGDD